MDRGAKVIVSGAGVLGLASALALADAGCAVSVWDPTDLGASASGVAAGMLAPAFESALDDPAHFDLLLAARDLWPALEARAGVAVDRAGALAAGSQVWLGGLAQAFAALGLHSTEIPRATASALAPGLSDAVEGVLLVREDWRIEPRAALIALRTATQAAGVTFRREAVRDLGGADRLVIATGASQALRGLAPELDLLTPIKGHILRMDVSEPPAVVVRGQGAYAVPAPGGVAVGATMEAGNWDPAVDPAQAAPLAAAGARLFPALAQAPRHLAAGVRAATPDGLPLAGFGADPRIVLATGARRNGWLLAPLVAKIVTACILDRDPGPYGGRLDPARFEGGGPRPAPALGSPRNQRS